MTDCRILVSGVLTEVNQASWVSVPRRSYHRTEHVATDLHAVVYQHVGEGLNPELHAVVYQHVGGRLNQLVERVGSKGAR